MKRIYILWAALIFCSCISESDQDLPRTDENLFQELTSGTWRVSFFEQDGIDLTRDFEGVNFNFLSSGEVEAFQGTQLLDEGSWTTSVGEAQVKFELSFSSNPLFQQMNEDWYQIRIGDDRISFREDDDISEDLLTFTKL